VGYEIAAWIPPGVADEAERWLVAYRRLCAPLSDEDAIRLLAKLRMTIVKKGDDPDWPLILDMWLEDLADFPGDIVLWAVGYWRRNEKFWPTWSEFLRLLERRTEQRKAAMDALRTIIDRGRASQEAAE
jgi:hypothetical protein